MHERGKPDSIGEQESRHSTTAQALTGTSARQRHTCRHTSGFAGSRARGAHAARDDGLLIRLQTGSP
eukprot:scaffold218590_cov15-Tisochrysis_lutea.AAC.1